MLDHDAFLAYLEVEKRYSPHTVSNYARDLRQLDAFLQSHYGTIQVNEISHDMLRSWVVELMESELAPRSIQRKISAVRTFFKVMRREGRISVNPTVQMRGPKAPKRLPKFVPETDMDQVMDGSNFTDDFPGARDALIMALLYETGMRQAELIGLRAQDVIVDRQELRVTGKRNKERRIPISQRLLKQIEAYTAYKEATFSPSNDPSLLVTNTGKKLYPSFVYLTVNRYLKRNTTIQQKSPHVLRHTFATHMLNHGADLNAIKEVLGHTSLAATQVYTHNSIEQLKKIHQQAHPKG